MYKYKIYISYVFFLFSSTFFINLIHTRFLTNKYLEINIYCSILFFNVLRNCKNINDSSYASCKNQFLSNKVVFSFRKTFQLFTKSFIITIYIIIPNVTLLLRIIYSSIRMDEGSIV